MADINVEITDKLVNSVSEFFIILSKNPQLIYLICGAMLCPFIYFFTKLILENISESRTDKLLDQNYKVLLEVKEALGKIYSKL
jgi:hypothetical protein